jgi:hypothetical protein
MGFKQAVFRKLETFKSNPIQPKSNPIQKMSYATASDNYAARNECRISSRSPAALRLRLQKKTASCRTRHAIMQCQLSTGSEHVPQHPSHSPPTESLSARRISYEEARPIQACQWPGPFWPGPAVSVLLRLRHLTCPFQRAAA